MASKHVSVCLVVVAIIAGSLGASAQTQPTGTWAPEASGNQARYGGFVSDGTYLYAYGSISNVNSQRFTRRYDPVSNTWIELGLMPATTQWNAGAYHNGYLYSFGTSTNASGPIYRYSIATATWTTVSATLTSGRFAAGAATLGDRIYIAGGVQGSATTLLDEFDPVALTITNRANMPGPLYRNVVVAVPGLNKIYAVGGINANGTQTDVCYEYTPADNTWATRAPMTLNGAPYPVQGPAGFSLSGRVYILGGHNPQTSYTSTTLEYNPGNNTWTQRASMATARSFHGGAAHAGKGYVYGGEPTYSTIEEYTPPVFGSAPAQPTDVGQTGSQAESALQALADANEKPGWTNSSVSFHATVTDPDAGQLVRLRVRVRPAAATTWTNATVLDSGLLAQGTLQVTWTIPGPGAFDWQYRVEDAFTNSWPAGAGEWADAFGNTASPDFRSDQIPPADPVAVSPDAVDLHVTSPASGLATLAWLESTDNGPVSGISYEIQVARDGAFLDIEAQLFSPSGTSEYGVTLSVSRYNKHWRLRARDVGGNFSAWSEPLIFRVTYDDTVDHGSGDAKKGCGLSAGAFPSGLALLAGLAFAAACFRRKRA